MTALRKSPSWSVLREAKGTQLRGAGGRSGKTMKFQAILYEASCKSAIRISPLPPSITPSINFVELLLHEGDSGGPQEVNKQSSSTRARGSGALR